MTPDLEARLVEKFPALFVGSTYPLTESLMAFGCECGDGWYGIIESACESIAAHCESNEIHDFAFMQIKQKFGTLRMYSIGGDEFISGALGAAEEKSCETCEQCGNPGSRNTEGYWIETLCEGCRHEKQ
jgi:hypothetical protein